MTLSRFFGDSALPGSWRLPEGGAAGSPLLGTPTSIVCGAQSVKPAPPPPPFREAPFPEGVPRGESVLDTRTTLLASSECYKKHKLSLCILHNAPPQNFMYSLTICELAGEHSAQEPFTSFGFFLHGNPPISSEARQFERVGGPFHWRAFLHHPAPPPSRKPAASRKVPSLHNLQPKPPPLRLQQQAIPLQPRLPLETFALILIHRTILKTRGKR